MKRLALALVAALTLSISSYAAPETVMLKIKADLQENFSQAAEVTYTESEEYIRASFIQDGKSTNVYYDLDGNLMGTARFVKLNELPASAQGQLTKQYSKATVRTAFIYEAKGEKPHYYLTLEEGKRSYMLDCDSRGKLSIFQRM